MPLDDIAARRKRELECYVRCVTLGELNEEVRNGNVSPELRRLLNCPDCGSLYHACTCDDVDEEFDEFFDADELGIDPEY